MIYSAGVDFFLDRKASQVIGVCLSECGTTVQFDSGHLCSFLEG